MISAVDPGELHYPIKHRITQCHPELPNDIQNNPINPECYIMNGTTKLVADSCSNREFIVDPRVLYNT